MNTALQINEPQMWLNKDPEPELKVWVNNEPKPALMQDAETGKLLAVSSFARGDSLQVNKPQELGLTKTCNLYLLGYGYDENRELFAIVPGPVPAKFRTAAEQPAAVEVVFQPPLPETVQEVYIRQYSAGAISLVRYKYEPEVNPVTKQISLPFNDLAA